MLGIDPETDRLAQAAYELFQFRNDEAHKIRMKAREKADRELETAPNNAAVEKIMAERLRAYEEFVKTMKTNAREYNQRLAKLGVSTSQI